MDFIRLRYALSALRKPVGVARYLDRDGRKKVVIFQRTIFGAKKLHTFEVVREFDAEGFEPDLKEIPFRVGKNQKGGSYEIPIQESASKPHRRA